LAALAHGTGALKPGQARIVVYREKSYGGLVDNGWKVNLDGEPMGSVKTGTFIYKDRPAGPHKLVLEWDPFPRPSHREVDVVSGRTYVFRVELNDKAQMMMATSSVGLAGFVVGAAISAAVDDRGSYDFTPIDEKNVNQALAEISLAE